MTVHLLRLNPDLRLASLWAASKNVSPPDGCDDGYVWHALLSAAFGKAMAPKPFSLRARRGYSPQLLAYSPHSAAELVSLTAKLADSEACAAVGLSTLASKIMPTFVAGQRLGFSSRLRPVVRADRDGDRNRSCEIDAYIHSRDRGDTRQKAEIYLDWACQRLGAGGVEIEAARLEGLDGVNVVRRTVDENHRRPFKSVPGHSVVVAGVLTVLEPALFNALVGRGIGRHRAFGFGMLLLSPAPSLNAVNSGGNQ